MQSLATPSLLLEPLSPDEADYAWLCNLYADPEVMRFIGSGVRPPEQARAGLDRLVAQAQRLGFGFWLLRRREDRARVGGALLMQRREDAPVELGFLLAREAWGHGFATQAARALVDHAFGALGLPELEAFADARNAASAAVLRHAGLRDAGLAQGPYGGTDRKFTLSRAQWLSGATVQGIE